MLRVLRPAAVNCTGLRRGRELDQLSLSVPHGARLLVVSDPDATASTLLRVLAGLSRIERGEIQIAGSRSPTAEGWGRRVAYLGPNPGLHTWMTPIEALHLAGELLDLAPDETARRVERAVAWARIPSDAASRPMRRGGEPLQQRTGLAAALIGDPEVLLLDEPLRAIEERERHRLLKLPGRRRTILLASRYPASEVDLMAHVAYLREGRVELIAPVGALERAQLPLSHRGIAALAQMRAAGVLARDAAPA
ncbi:MAG TPA: ATP-binding cassette domain-containing protein [Candidatus Limnocylindrales bacterium]|nr:ATP-binding cassette domain-containing protein [Candidatus Limnocylindrales bacterium]